jgi:hypothetical protein
MKEWLDEYYQRLSSWTSTQLMKTMTATERATHAGAVEAWRKTLLWVLVFQLREVLDPA